MEGRNKKILNLALQFLSFGCFFSIRLKLRLICNILVLSHNGRVAFTFAKRADGRSERETADFLQKVKPCSRRFRPLSRRVQCEPSNTILEVASRISELAGISHFSLQTPKIFERFFPPSCPSTHTASRVSGFPGCHAAECA